MFSNSQPAGNIALCVNLPAVKTRMADVADSVRARLS